METITLEQLAEKLDVNFEGYKRAHERSEVIDIENLRRVVGPFKESEEEKNKRVKANNLSIATSRLILVHNCPIGCPWEHEVYQLAAEPRAVKPTPYQIYRMDCEAVAWHHINEIIMTNIDLWARFLSHEKLVPDRIDPEDTMELVRLCEELAKIEGPKYRPYKDRLETRRLLCLTAMELGIDLPDIRHKFTKKRLIGRGLLDAWNAAYIEKYSSNYGTESMKEAKRRDIKTLLSKKDY